VPFHISRAALTEAGVAVFGLAWFRDKDSIPLLGAGFGLPQATACRVG